MKQDRKKLYESIMTSIAKEVKKALNESVVAINMEDAIDVFRNWLDEDDFADGMSGHSCDGWYAVKNAGGISGLLDWAATWDDLASQLGTDEDGLRDWLEVNEDTLYDALGIDDVDGWVEENDEDNDEDEMYWLHDDDDEWRDDD